MSNQLNRILVIENDPEEAARLRALLTDRNSYLCQFEWTRQLGAGLERLARSDIDIILLNLSLPDCQGLESFTKLSNQAPNVPIIVLCNLDDKQIAISAVQAGAQDYLVKEELNSTLLIRAIRYGIECKQTQESLRTQKQRLEHLANRQLMLYEVLRVVADQTDPSAVARAAVETLTHFAGWSNVMIALPNEDGTHWIVQAVGGLLSAMGGLAFSMEKGIIGRAFRTGQTQLVPDVIADLDYIVGHAAIRSQLTVPLKCGGLTLGVLDLQSGQPAAFRPDDVRLAESLAEIVALALNTPRLYHEIRQQATDLNTLYIVSRMVGRSLVLEEVLSRALSSVLMSLGFEAGMICLANPVNGRLRLVVDRGLPSILARDDQRRKLVDTLCTTVYDRGQNLVLTGLDRERRPSLSRTINQMTTAGLAACACVPLRHQEQSLGVLSLFAHQPRLFSKREMALLDAIGQQVATAVAHARLFQTAAKYEFIVNTSGEFMSLINKNFVYEVANEAYCQAHNRTAAEIIGRPVAEIWGQNVFKTVLKPHLEDCFKGREVQFQAWFELPNLDQRCLEVTYSPYYEKGSVTHAVVVSRDITEPKRVQEQLFHRAFHDTLTDLPNRTFFMDRLGRALEKSKLNGHYLFAVLFLDLDRFKTINDSLGHLVGDQLLIVVARRLEASIRPDDIVARFGGDEFAILLDDIQTVDEARQVADRIQKSLASPITLNGFELFSTASIGITANTRKYEQPEELLRDADTAMYQAKTRGKAQYALFDTGQLNQAVLRQQLEADLWRAVERREFVVYYQPFVSLAHGRITGVEALLRWQHPQHGLLAPGQFIDLAEETGLILPISEWVLHTACTQIKAWHLAGHVPLRLAVNISTRQLQDRKLPGLIRTVLAHSGLAPEKLELEITECTAVVDNDLGLRILKDLQAFGVRISVDDFGLGSSLDCLKCLPLDTLKIDQSFVRDLSDEENNAAIIRAMIAMAHSLRLRVIAEGVETEEHLAFLQRQQCNEIQGYLVSRPLSAKACLKLLQAG